MANLLQWGEWKPDLADYEGTATKNILNVLPRGDGYGPFPSQSAFSQSLPATCRGCIYALKSDGSVVIFAATVDRIYLLNNTDFSWKNVSKVATVTSISNANPGVITYTNTFAANDPVVFGGTVLPSQLVAGTTYYVSATGLSGGSFSVSATPGGARISTSAGGGSGTPTVTTIYPALSSSANWQCAQTGNLVWFTQANVVLQVFDLSSASAFVDATGSPPQAAYISVVQRFLVLSGLLSTPYRIQWSGLNNFNASTSWDNVTLGSNLQDLPDGGVVRGVAGGETGIIFQDQAVRRMSFVAGSPFTFQIDKITQDMGLFAPYSIVRASEKIFFYSSKGFYKIDPGGVPVQIGRERVDRTFLADLDKASLQLFLGAADPKSSRVFWAYKSVAGQTGLYDKVMGYDYVLDRFFPVMVSGEYFLGISQTGLTLENLDTISSSIDALTLTLDAYATAVQPEIAQFDSTHKLNFFRGLNLEATLETAEQGTDFGHIFCNGFKCVTDAPAVYGSISHRGLQSSTATAGAEILISSRTGRVDARRSSHYMRFKNRIPAGTVWTYNAGVVPDVEGDGDE